jgi:hypothetical protein
MRDSVREVISTAEPDGSAAVGAPRARCPVAGIALILTQRWRG